MKTFVSFLVLVMLSLSAVFAAPEPTVSYTVNILDPGVTNPNTPTRSGSFAASTATCNLAKVAASAENPTFVRFDDPADVSKDCRIDVTSLFATLPYADGYRFVIRAHGASIVGEWSALSDPFDYVPPYVTTPENVRPE